ncbi:MAG: sigma 54-interacting transcriptional regulator [Mailhella sp.]|nr:sigma 54-interacting transcriptional regulator [Mailhella sp.]
MHTANAFTDPAIGESDIFLDLGERITALAVCPRPVLIIGERGTGKELAARRLHYFSPRWDKPMVAFLCPAITESIAESELFGYEAGAFTGARGTHKGLWEKADGGTLFLDEIGDMPLFLQDKLLRVIEYGTFQRVGGGRELHADVRVVAATNKDLPSLVREGRFRADLLDRLSFDVVHIPPLRMRGSDIILLALHFASAFLRESGRKVPAGKDLIPEGIRRQMLEHPWPGNVRELKNAVERSLLRSPDGTLAELILDPFAAPWDHAARPEQAAHHGGTEDAREHEDAEEDARKEPLLPHPASPLHENQGRSFSLDAAVEDFERGCIKKALEAARYRQKEAADILGISYNRFRTLYRKHSPLK